MEENERTDALFAGLILRLRHAKAKLQVDVDRIDAAIGVLTATEVPETKQIEATVVTVEATPVKQKRGGLSQAIRMAVSKIGPAKTGEIHEYVTRMGFKSTSSTVSAFLSQGKSRGEYRRDDEGRWGYTGGVIRSGKRRA